MRKPDKLKGLVYKDCLRVIVPALCWYIPCMIIGRLLSTYIAGALGSFADAVFQLNFSYGLQNVWKLLVAVGGSVLFVPALDCIGQFFDLAGALRYDRTILSHYLDKQYAKAVSIGEGEVVTRLEQDGIDFRCYLTVICMKLVSLPVTLAYLLYHALGISLLFTGIVFLISMVKLAVPIAVRKLQARYDKWEREYRASVRECENEMTHGTHIVKMYGLSDAFLKRFDRMYQDFFRNVFRKSAACTVIAEQVLSFLDTFCVLLILLAGALLVSVGDISAGAVVAMTGYFSVFNDLIGQVDDVVRKVPMVKNLAERMGLFYEDAQILDGKPIGTVHTVVAENLSFSYGQNTVFEKVSFSVALGSKTAICGPNGSGKSTLIKLLSGLLNGYGGSLRVNGTELRDVAAEQWCTQFAYAPQDPYLFEGTVKENVRLGNLSAGDDVIEKLMHQLGISHLADRQVSSQSSEFSGGEKQRISIARALAKGTEFLILDEPGNNLDGQTAEWLQAFISSCDKTVIFISHDGQLLHSADSLIQMTGGATHDLLF